MVKNFGVVFTVEIINRLKKGNSLTTLLERERGGMVKILVSFFVLGIMIPSWVSSYIARFQNYPNASHVGFPLQGEESNYQSFVGCSIKCVNTPPCAAIILNVELKMCKMELWQQTLLAAKQKAGLAIGHSSAHFCSSTTLVEGTICAGVPFLAYTAPLTFHFAVYKLELPDWYFCGNLENLFFLKRVPASTYWQLRAVHWGLLTQLDIYHTQAGASMPPGLYSLLHTLHVRGFVQVNVSPTLSYWLLLSEE